MKKIEIDDCVIDVIEEIRKVDGEEATIRVIIQAVDRMKEQRQNTDFIERLLLKLLAYLEKASPLDFGYIEWANFKNAMYFLRKALLKTENL